MLACVLSRKPCNTFWAKPTPRTLVPLGRCEDSYNDESWAVSRCVFSLLAVLGFAFSVVKGLGFRDAVSEHIPAGWSCMRLMPRDATDVAG